MHSELSLALSREQASLGAARLLHVDEQLQACRKAIRHRLRLDLHLAPRAERHQSVRKARLFVRHRDKTLDSGASSGGTCTVFSAGLLTLVWSIFGAIDWLLRSVFHR